MRGAFAAPDSHWPDASVPPALLRMGVAAVQLLLITSHVFVFEHVLMLWNKTKNKDDMELHKYAQARTTSNRVIFRNGSMQVTHSEVLHAKERMNKLNIDVGKPKLGRLWHGLKFKLSWSATWRRR